MLKDLVIRNRSFRGYDSSCKMTKEELESLVDLTRYTASSVNLQPLKYHIAWEEDEVGRIQGMTKWAAALPQLKLPYPGKCPTGFIIICIDTSLAPNPSVFLRDVGIAAQTMLLAAVEAGLGGCMIGNFSQEEVRKQLNLPESTEPNLIIAIGKPDEDIILTPVGADGSTRYYRDETGLRHFVPKRSLDEILI